jgi:sugar O-acyltransferase (sialic acid O-acetyltransferase NeuD family)
MKDLFIVGTGGLAREVATMVLNGDCQNQLGQFRGFISVDCADIGNKFAQGQVVGSDRKLPFDNEEVELIIAIGYPKIKKRVSEFYSKIPNVTFPNLISKASKFDCETSKIGIGNILAHNVFVSCNVEIADFCLLNWNVTVGHDANIGSNCVINPHAHISGNVSIGAECLIGASSVILETIKVADRAIVGAGAVVTKNVIENTVVVGIPAKIRCSDEN